MSSRKRSICETDDTVVPRFAKHSAGRLSTRDLVRRISALAEVNRDDVRKVLGTLGKVAQFSLANGICIFVEGFGYFYPHPRRGKAYKKGQRKLVGPGKMFVYEQDGFNPDTWSLKYQPSNTLKQCARSYAKIKAPTPDPKGSVEFSMGRKLNEQRRAILHQVHLANACHPNTFGLPTPEAECNTRTPDQTPCKDGSASSSGQTEGSDSSGASS